ncbi:ubiquinol-cytochrome C chaperone-domain-containing protein [Phlyctochytrium arcticum]|nr:ubiquinol-cytochrome C chaperone-domain-containing protein [Phlyctochytrium arcticum]
MVSLSATRCVRPIISRVAGRCTGLPLGSYPVGVCSASLITSPHGKRRFGTAGVQKEDTFPYQGPLAKVLNPFGYIRWKMNRIDAARVAYEACSVQTEERKALIESLKLPDNFQTWFSVTLLHVWLYNARLRAMGPAGKEMKQELFDYIWLDVEMKVHEAGVKRNLNKVIGDLVSTYYGTALAYDEGLYYGDAVFVSALWRNIYGQGDVDATDLEALLSYTRRQLQRIEAADRAQVLDGSFKFVQ